MSNPRKILHRDHIAHAARRARVELDWPSNYHSRARAGRDMRLVLLVIETLAETDWLDAMQVPTLAVVIERAARIADAEMGGAR